MQWGCLAILRSLLRLNSFFFALPILYTLWIQPSAWPFCSAIGIFSIVLNNHSNYEFCREAQTKINTVLPATPVPHSAESFLNEFSGWWELMLWYGVCFMLIGVLLRVGVVRDEWVYASVVLVINSKLYFYNCKRRAPQMRARTFRLSTRGFVEPKHTRSFRRTRRRNR